MDERDVSSNFSLMRKAVNGDQAALESLRVRPGRLFKTGDKALLVICPTDIAGVWNGLYISDDGQNGRFWMPQSFDVSEASYQDETLSLRARDGRSIQATPDQLRWMFEELPFGGSRINAPLVKRVFESCGKPTDTSDHVDDTLGRFIFRERRGYVRELAPTLMVHTRDRRKLDAACAHLVSLMTRIDQLDSIAKEQLRKRFSPTADELDALRLEGVDFFVDGEFDLTYLVPEEAIEYVRVCFGKDCAPVEATFGNF